MVAANSLLDVIAGAVPGGDTSLTVDERVHIANELVARTLDEYEHNEAMDTYGNRRQYRRLLARATEVAFRCMHEEWLTKAEGLLTRVKEMDAAGHTISRLQDLKVAVASTRQLLQFSADEAERLAEDVRNGRGHYHTLEEVRRELRAQAGR